MNEQPLFNMQATWLSRLDGYCSSLQEVLDGLEKPNSEDAFRELHARRLSLLGALSETHSVLRYLTRQLNEDYNPPANYVALENRGWSYNRSMV